MDKTPCEQLLEIAPPDKGGVTVLPDGSGFYTSSMPLPKDHWLAAEGFDNPPMPFRCGQSARREELKTKIRSAAKYAIRASTMNGKEEDFDPDAMVQNMIIGLLGYETPDGLSSMDDGMWNPDPIPPRDSL